jgi:hypothetical protein
MRYRSRATISYEFKRTTPAVPRTTPPRHPPSARHSLLATRHFFHSPYPPTPLFATLTKTAGVYSSNSHSGTRTLPFSLSPFVSYSSELFCHHAKLNSFVFLRFRTLSPKHPGVGMLQRFPARIKVSQEALHSNSTKASARHKAVGREVSPCSRFAPRPYKCLLNYIGQIFHRAGLAEHSRHSLPRPRSQA